MLRHFLSNTSLHGFKYLTAAKDEKRWKMLLAKTFWTCFIAISIVLMAMILTSTFGSFSSKATTINLDTNYRYWNNTFPAVSICMTKGRSTNKIKDYMLDYWEKSGIAVPSRAIRYYRGIQSLMFLNNQQPLDGINVDTCSEFNETCGVDLDIIKRDLLPQTCHDFITHVEFLEVEIPCDEIFKLQRTDIGDCFVSNSLYSSGKIMNSFEKLPLRYSNHLNVDRLLRIHYIDIEFVIYKLFIHSPEELPDGNLEGFGLRKAQAETYMAFKVTEIENTPDVIEESIEARQCRFPIEMLHQFKLPYSISNCNFDVRLERELRSCDCLLPIGDIPKTHNQCNVTRFQCIRDAFVDYEHSLHADDGDDEEEDEDDHTNGKCSIPTCLSMEIVEVGHFEKELSEAKGVLLIEILNMPTLKYIRRVAISKLDMIVQVGGIVGLFLGASILSLLEIFFLIMDMLKRSQ